MREVVRDGETNFYKNEFLLHGTVRSFDEKTRLLILKAPDPNLPFLNLEILILVPLTCVCPPERDIEAGQNILVAGRIISHGKGARPKPTLIALEISRDDDEDDEKENGGTE